MWNSQLVFDAQSLIEKGYVVIIELENELKMVTEIILYGAVVLDFKAQNNAYVVRSAQPLLVQ